MTDMDMGCTFCCCCFSFVCFLMGFRFRTLLSDPHSGAEGGGNAPISNRRKTRRRGRIRRSRRRSTNTITTTAAVSACCEKGWRKRFDPRGSQYYVTVC